MRLQTISINTAVIILTGDNNQFSFGKHIMRIQSFRKAISAVLMFLCFGTVVVAQSDSKYGCDQQPLGLFRQSTSSTLELSQDYYKNATAKLEPSPKNDRLELDPLDEVDPAYKFYLIRVPNGPVALCGAVMAVTGKFISPTGKVFDLVRATYDIPARRLRFSTVEKEGIKYEAEAEFFAKPEYEKGRFKKGRLKLRASGKGLGVVLIEFSFTSWNFE